MKKVVSAFLAGALMMVSVQAFGDSISQIGKKIQTEYTVTVDGQQLTVPAIAVDGKSYAPVRAIGEAAGYDIAVTGKSITLTTKEIVPVAENTPVESQTAKPSETTKPSVDISSQVVKLQTKVNNLKLEITMIQNKLGFDSNNQTLKDQLSTKMIELEKAQAEFDKFKSENNL